MNTLDEFRKIAADVKTLDKVAERDLYSHDIGDVPPIMTKTFLKTLPDFVVQPKSIDEIKKVLAFANNQKIPVTPGSPRGASAASSRPTGELSSTCHPSARSWGSTRPRRPLP
jgi:hypothetical protein